MSDLEFKIDEKKLMRAIDRVPDLLLKNVHRAFVREGAEWEREQLTTQMSGRSKTTLGVVTGNARRSIRNFVKGDTLDSLVLVRGFSDTPVKVSIYLKYWENPFPHAHNPRQQPGLSRLGLRRVVTRRWPRTIELIDGAIDRSLKEA